MEDDYPSNTRPFVAYVSSLAVCIVCRASPATSPKNRKPPPLTIASGTYNAWGKSGYLNLLSRVYGEITLLIGCIQDRLIDLQASSRSNWHISKIFDY